MCRQFCAGETVAEPGKSKEGDCETAGERPGDGAVSRPLGYRAAGQEEEPGGVAGSILKGISRSV